jgi:hypothetical protein
MIVEVLIAHAKGQHPLAKQLHQRMFEIARIAFIPEAGSEIFQVPFRQVHLSQK